MRRFMYSVMLVLALVIFLIAGLFWWFIRSQGISNAQLAKYTKATILRDQMGVFSIDGFDWLQIIQAQGFAAASERLFQMDLMRRKGDGALAEIFGKDALSYDRQQRLEDWRYYASKAYETMGAKQRDTCDAYARGVNEFIDQFPSQTGIEYLFLNSKPATWSCVDSILVAMVLSDNMTRSWSRDLDMSEWRKVLPDSWWNFVFPTRHPWNELVFDHTSAPILPAPEPQLPASHPRDEDFILNTATDPRGLNGSNSWAYRGEHGAWLANDPHVANTVPQLWLPMRLSTADGWWVVGVAAPGLPGVLIGMNNHLAWSITNTAEDVDDAVFETPDQIIETTKREIFVRGGESESITIRRTPRGPIVKEISPQKWVARQWLAQKTGILSLPAENLNHASDWETFNQAIDEFRFVPLSFTMLDRNQNMGLRISGCDVSKVSPGSYAVSWEHSAWAPECPTTGRRRLYLPFDETKKTAFIATANQRLWDDQKIHNWADDDRINRIREILSQSESLTMDDMRLLQLDTTTPFHRKFLNWLIQNGQSSLLDPSQLKAWQGWTGDIKDCPMCMSEADDLSLILDQLILNQISSNFSPSKSPLPTVRREMKRARIVYAIEKREVLGALGLQANEVADGLLRWVSRKSSRKIKPWQERNLWGAQHPFVGRIPLIDRIFMVKDWPQFGAATTVRAERPNHGPSMRVIWSLGNPTLSQWSFPVGASGHALSPHYQNWLNLWQSGGMMQIPIPTEP
jgi:penicillin amidase